ncbi:MAG: nucleotide exchange factor GrpE [Armatimonadota bacterium]
MSKEHPKQIQYPEYKTSREYEILVGVNELILIFKPNPGSGSSRPLIHFSYDAGANKITLLQVNANFESRCDQVVNVVSPKAVDALDITVEGSLLEPVMDITPPDQELIEENVELTKSPILVAETLPTTAALASEGLEPGADTADPKATGAELTASLDADVDDGQLVTEEVSQVEVPIEQQPSLSFDPLPMALSVWSQEQADRQADEEELKSLLAKVNFWNSRASTLEAGVGVAFNDAEKVLVSLRDVLITLPIEVQDSLKGRQEGLELIVRMLSRLPDATKGLTGDSCEPAILPEPFGNEAWINYLREVSDATAANVLVKRKMAELSSDRYRIITGTRDLVEKVRKRVLQSVERKVLPIIDGLDDGERHSAEMIRDLQTGLDGEAIQHLDYWFAGYGNLRNDVLLGMLENIRIRPMMVSIGVPIDYEQHEPFDTEVDSSLPNEAVKEVVRAGYVYESSVEGEIEVLRAAQVIVVKN